jgi:hypothetical protein
MPLIRVDMTEGGSPDEIKALLDATHRTLVSVFKIPQRDRYQIVHEHPTSHFVVEDTGLGITRTRKCVVIQVTTRPREREAKESCSAASWRRRAAYHRPTSSCRWLRTLTRIGPSGTAARNS